MLTRLGKVLIGLCVVNTCAAIGYLQFYLLNWFLNTPNAVEITERILFIGWVLSVIVSVIITAIFAVDYNYNRKQRLKKEPADSLHVVDAGGL